MNKPNIVVICLDTFRADIVGQGKKFSHIRTPALDQLYDQSIRFNQCYGEALATLQVRNTNFTGMRGFPFKNGYYGWHEVPKGYPTVAEHLVSGGYATGLIADTPHIFKPNMNFSRGFLTFEHVRGQTSDSWRIGPWDTVASSFKDYFGNYLPTPSSDSNVSFYAEGQVLQYLHNIRDRINEEDWFAPRVFTAGSRWIKDNANNSPFFLWMDCFETHELFDPPHSYIKEYNDTWEGPKYQQPEHILSARLHSDIGGDSVQGLSEEFLDYYVACYMAEVTFTDKYIGMFLENLHKLGLEDDTALIFTSDHGTELADLSGLGKRESQLHPFTTKLNLLLRHPEKSLNNSDVENLVQNQDIAPTILELAGMEEKSFEMDGTSLLRIVNDDNHDQDEFVITGWNDYASVRDYEWNYITNWISDEPRPELYDLNSDRDEAHNVCDLNPDVASKFKSRLENHLGGRLPRPQDQIRSDGASGMEYKPLYSTSYAPLFYKARMGWDDPGALPK